MTEDPKQEPNFRVTDRRGQPKEEPSPFKAQEPPKPQAKQEKPSEQTSRSGNNGQQIDFANFVISLSTSALMHLGLVEDPDTGEASEKNLPAARQEIGIMEMLAEKTKGNLNPQEAKLMEQVLYELHLRFVEASK